MSEIGILNHNIINLINGNSKELSTIEGNIVSVSAGREVKTILITSCAPLEGKTVSAISIAYTLAAEANAKVVLVDGNFNSPKIYELFDIKATPGLSDLLTDKADYRDIIRNTEYKNLSIIPHGSDMAKKLDFFDLNVLRNKLEILRKEFDHVIIDGQSLSGSSDISLISKYFDGIVFVVECEKTRWEVLQQAKEKINNSGGKILGVVLNKRIYYIPGRLYGKI